MLVSFLSSLQLFVAAPVAADTINPPPLPLPTLPQFSSYLCPCVVCSLLLSLYLTEPSSRMPPFPYISASPRCLFSPSRVLTSSGIHVVVCQNICRRAHTPPRTSSLMDERRDRTSPYVPIWLIGYSIRPRSGCTAFVGLRYCHCCLQQPGGE
ncbi:hypothetical protein C8T65DRAFT_88743 [Cerioporus squamosus]|nr:hypothetical protein C8T65DRAFT_88743 [Cerioporus squamosus]